MLPPRIRVISSGYAWAVLGCQSRDQPDLMRRMPPANGIGYAMMVSSELRGSHIDDDIDQNGGNRRGKGKQAMRDQARACASTSLRELQEKWALVLALEALQMINEQAQRHHRAVFSWKVDIDARHAQRVPL